MSEEKKRIRIEKKSEQKSPTPNGILSEEKGSPKGEEIEYTGFDNPIDWILHRPDSLAGSLKSRKEEVWILRENSNPEEREISYNPGLEKMFMEPLDNATDNVVKSREDGVDPGKIEVMVDSKRICIYNEGLAISTKESKKKGVPKPQFIFGTLFTSGKYDDRKKRFEIGRNGVGVKICSIMSRKSKIEVANEREKILYVQEFENNMKTVHPPVLTTYFGKSFTRVTFELEFERFGVKEISEDMICLFRKRAFDAAFTARVPVTFNGKRFEFSKLEEYANNFVSLAGKNYLVHEEKFDGDEGEEEEDIKNSGSIRVCLIETPKQGSVYLFVNGSPVKRGAAFMNDLYHAFFDDIFEYFNSKKKRSVTVKTFGTHMTMIIVASLDKPMFDDQTKKYLVSPNPKFQVPAALRRKIDTWDIRKIIEASLNDKFTKELAKPKRRLQLVNLPKLRDAKYAGTPKSEKCTLCLTEGDSARGFATRGFEYFDLDETYGVYPLKGKTLNVTNKEDEQMLANKEVSDIREAINLSTETDYSQPENRKKLRYGRVLLMTDADVDGIHIQGLLINLFGQKYKTLLEIGFVEIFMVPLITAKKRGRPDKEFYFEHEFLKWESETKDADSYEIKYFKGLATCTNDEVKRAFEKMVVCRVKYDPHAGDSLSLGFNKEYADARKDWLSQPYEEEKTRLSGGKVELTVSDFVKYRLYLFSIDNLRRQIPNRDSGLKPSQIKIFWAARMREEKQKDRGKEVKVAVLSGYVSEHSHYRHGEENLNGTIIGMTQDFLGANNIPIFQKVNEFGSRLDGGKKTAGKPRYIHNFLHPLTWLLYPTIDDKLLKQNREETFPVEYEEYYPIIPGSLINGAFGIGTAYSTNTPPFNPLDLVEGTLEWIEDEEKGFHKRKLKIAQKKKRKITIAGAQTPKTPSESPLSKDRKEAGGIPSSGVQLPEKEEKKGENGGSETEKNEEKKEGSGQSETSTPKKEEKGENAVKEGKKPRKKLIPWYRGFTGKIREMKTGNFMAEGVFHVEEDGTVIVTELPPEKWTDDYDKVLKKMREKKEIQSHHIRKGGEKIHIEIVGMKDPTLKSLKLTQSIPITNMVLFTEKGVPKRYSSPEKILFDFCRVRYPLYRKRKEMLLKELKEKVDETNLRYQFVEKVASEEIKIRKRNRQEIKIDMDKHGFPMDFLKMALWNLGEERLKKLRAKAEKLQKEYDEIFNKSPGDLWREDLRKFEEEYKKFYPEDTKKKSPSKIVIATPREETRSATESKKTGKKASPDKDSGSELRSSPQKKGSRITIEKTEAKSQASKTAQKPEKGKRKIVIS